MAIPSSGAARGQRISTASAIDAAALPAAATKVRPRGGRGRCGGRILSGSAAATAARKLSARRMRIGRSLPVGARRGLRYPRLPMTTRTRPPFRADHVGSFLRPKELLEARERHFKQNALTRAQLRAVEDRAILGIVKRQEEWGLQGVTDGEFRRTYFHVDFLEQLEGVEVKGGIPVKFHGAAGDVDFAPPVMHVTKKLKHVTPIQLEDFEFLKSVTTRTPKVTIPSPTMLHFRGGRGAISREAYPDMEGFYEDVGRCYRDEIRQLADAGCRYLQLDDTNLAYLCDAKMREGARRRGDDPDELPRRHARLINSAI